MLERFGNSACSLEIRYGSSKKWLPKCQLPENAAEFLARMLETACSLEIRLLLPHEAGFAFARGHALGMKIYGEGKSCSLAAIRKPI